MSKKKTTPPLRVTTEVIEKICDLHKDSIKGKVDGMHNNIGYKAKEIGHIVGGSATVVRNIISAWYQLNESTDWTRVRERYRANTGAKPEPKTKQLTNSNSKEKINNIKSKLKELRKFGKIVMQKSPDIIEMKNPTAIIKKAKSSSIDSKYWEDHGNNLGVVMPYEDWKKIHSMILVLLRDRAKALPKGVVDEMGIDVLDSIVPYSWRNTETGELKGLYNLRTEVDLKSGQYYYGLFEEYDYKDRTTPFTEEEEKEISRKEKADFDTMIDSAYKIENELRK